MKYSTAIGCVVALCATFTGNVNAATAQYNGTLNLTDLQYSVPLNGVQADAAVDLLRFDLGSGWSGNLEVLLTTSPYNALTTIGFALTTDPNDLIFNDPAPFLNLVDMTNAEAFFDEHVNGREFASWGPNSITNGGTTDVTASLSSPFQLDPTSNYYAFVAGGALLPNSVDVGLQVSSVPVPAAVWLFGSGIIGLLGMARRKKA